MLEAITWTQFIIATISFLAVWYVVIWVCYYRENFTARFYRNETSPLAPSENLNYLPVKQAVQLDEERLSELDMILTDIRHRILEGGEGQLDKKGLISELKKGIYAYQGLNDPVFRQSINNQIIDFSQQFCDIQLSLQELEQTWDPLLRHEDPGSSAL